MAHPYRLTLGQFTDAATRRVGARVDVENISTVPFGRIELEWVCDALDSSTHKMGQLRLRLAHAVGQDGQALSPGQTHTFVIPPEMLFEADLMVQATPPARSKLIATIDGREMPVLPGEVFAQLVERCRPFDGMPGADIAGDRMQYLINLTGAIIELAGAYKVYPPKEVTADPAVLDSPDVVARLDGTKWWLQFADGREELLNFRELLILTYNVFIVRTRLAHLMYEGKSTAGFEVSLMMAVPNLMTREGVQSLIGRLSLESMPA